MVSIALHEVTVRLRRRMVVRGVSAMLEPGTLVGVLGPNGAGKSTLVRAILGLVPHDGRVTIDTLPRDTLSRAAVARAVAYLPQGGAVHWPVSVERLVALGRLPHLAPLSRLGAGDAAAVADAMARADVAHLAARPVTELSGGERARVLLARALAVGAGALVADEPLASLDPAHAIAGMELLAAEAARGRLVVAVLHDLTLAARYCDRVLVMADGALVADGAPAAVLDDALLARVYGIAAYRGPDALLVPHARLTAGPAAA